MQQQVNRKGMPERMAADGKRRAPYPVHQRPDMAVHGLARHGKNLLGLAKPSRVQIALDAVLQQVIADGHIAARRALVGGLGGPSGPALQRLENHAEVVAVVDETRWRERERFGDARTGGPHQIEDQPVGRVLFGVQQHQHFGFEQVRRHGVDGFEHRRSFGDQTVPVDSDGIDGKAHHRRLEPLKERLRARGEKSRVGHRHLYQFPR